MQAKEAYEDKYLIIQKDPLLMRSSLPDEWQHAADYAPRFLRHDSLPVTIYNMKHVSFEQLHMLNYSLSEIFFPSPIHLDAPRLPKNANPLTIQRQQAFFEEWQNIKKKIVAHSTKEHFPKTHEQLFLKLPQDIKAQLVTVFSKLISYDLSIDVFEKEFFDEFLKYLDDMPLGSWDFDLVQEGFTVYVPTVVDTNYGFESHYPLLRNVCERYLREKDAAKKQEALSEIGFHLRTVKASEKSTKGTLLPFIFLNQFSLIKKIHEFGDQSLIDLFSKYIPVPKADKFTDHVPFHVFDKEFKENMSIWDFTYRNKHIPYEELVNKIKCIQRQFRAQRRQVEERNRIEHIREIEEIEDGAQAMYLTADKYQRAANKPYIPKGGSKALRQRIMSQSGNIQIISEVCHRTSRSALKDIFNDALYGRRTLLEMFKAFKPAVLAGIDVDNGDGNVICLTSDYGIIDPSLNADVELVFDFDMIKATRNKTAFFKQFDLGFNLEHEDYANVADDCTEDDNNAESLARRTVSIPGTNKKLVFIQQPIQDNKKEARLRNYDVRLHVGLFDANDAVASAPLLYVDLPQFYFISYNMARIDQILTLNFFRFIDALATKNAESKKLVESIYASLETLNDRQLNKFLIKLGVGISNTMEFNFYGAHQIAFDTLKSIECLEKAIKIDINKMVEELKAGKETLYQKAVRHFPEIFKSQRFVDYLQRDRHVPTREPHGHSPRSS